MIILMGREDSDYLALSIKGDELQIISHEMRPLNTVFEQITWYDRPMISIDLDWFMKCLDAERRREGHQ